MASAGTNGIQSGKEEEFFVHLCNNISNCVTVHFQSILSLLNLSNDLMYHDIPTSVQLKLSINSAEIQRTFLIVKNQVEELTRLTKLYSTSWEEKNQCIKALHHQYNIKQRKLDIAVKKLEILSGRNQALEKLRIQVNWEKMFMKLNENKSSSFGWRHVVNEYKQSIGNGKTVGHLFKNLETPIEVPTKFNVHVESINGDLDGDPNSELDFGRQTPSFCDSYLDRFSSEEDDELRFSSQLDEDEDVKGSSIRNWISTSSQMATAHVSVKNVECQYVSDTKDINLQTEPPVTANKTTSTHEIKYRNIMIVSFQVPANIKRLSDQCCCTVAVNNRFAKKVVDQENTDRVEFVFDFQFENDFILVSDEFRNGTLRIGFHNAEGDPMMVFAVVPLCDLNVTCNRDRLKVIKGSSNVTMRSAIDEKGFKFNQPCGDLPVQCHILQSALPSQLDKTTETLSMSEIVEDLLQARMREQLKRCKSACIETDEKPVYTEQDLEVVRDELASKLQELKDKYEEEINTVLLSHTSSVGNKHYANAATSPILMNRVVDMRSLPGWEEEGNSRVNTAESKPNVKRLKFSQQWGKDLPPKFLTRLHMFQDASQQYHKELKNKTVEIEKLQIKKKLDAEKKLSIGRPNGYSVYSKDVYLPAVFMPIKSKQDHPISGRSYLTEPIRSLQLPFLINDGEQKEHTSFIDTL